MFIYLKWLLRVARCEPANGLLATDGDKLYIDIISPDSISTQFLKVYVMHPRGITTPGFAINSATFYDQNGLDITATASITSVLDYYPR